MDQMTGTDQQRLLDHGIGTIVDLRMDKEIAAAPNVFTAHRHARFVIHDFWGKRFDAYRSKNKTASLDQKLAALYCEGLVESGFVIAEIMATFADDRTGGYAFHCRSGKDRTGLVAALLLAIAGVPAPTICDDYGLTANFLISPDADKQIDPNQPGAYLRGCAPATMAMTLGFLNQTFGSPLGYLQHIGVTGAQISAIKSKLLD